MRTEWKNIYRRITTQNNDRTNITLQELEKVAFKFGVFMSIDDLNIIEKKCGGSTIDIDEFSK